MCTIESYLNKYIFFFFVIIVKVILYKKKTKIIIQEHYPFIVVYFSKSINESLLILIMFFIHGFCDMNITIVRNTITMLSFRRPWIIFCNLWSNRDRFIEKPAPLA